MCDAGFYDANASTAIDPELLRVSSVECADDPDKCPPTEMLAAVVECHECPVGTSCEQMSTLEELPLLQGYYRLDTTTVDVRECPDARENCSTTFGKAVCMSTSGCQGGKGFPCAPGLTGTYCELCERPEGELMTYVGASKDEVAHCEPCGDNMVITIVYGLAGLAMICVMVGLLMCIIRTLPASFVKRLKYLNDAFTPKNKLKVVVGCRHDAERGRHRHAVHNCHDHVVATRLAGATNSSPRCQLCTRSACRPT